MKSSLAVLIFLAFAACGDDSSPTRPSSPAPPPPQARVEIERVVAEVSIYSIFPPRLIVTYDLRIRETAGVAVTFQNAQLEIFNPAGRRIINKRVNVNEDISANGQERVDLTWIIGVGGQDPDDIDSVRTTYRFVDENGYHKKLQLTGGETEVSGLRVLWSQISTE